MKRYGSIDAEAKAFEFVYAQISHKSCGSPDDNGVMRRQSGQVVVPRSWCKSRGKPRHHDTRCWAKGLRGQSDSSPVEVAAVVSGLPDPTIP